MRKFAWIVVLGAMGLASGAWADCGCQSVNKPAPAGVKVYVDYGKSLCDLICAGHFDYVNSDITVEHFPITQHPNARVEMKVFSTEELVGKTRSVTSEEVIQALKDKGYREAELPEGLAYAKANPDEQRKYPIVILGSVWRVFDDGYVPYLWVDSSRRSLSLYWFENGWRENYRFLGVRK